MQFIQNIFSKRQVTMIFTPKDPGNNLENFFSRTVTKTCEIKSPRELSATLLKR